MTIKIGYYSSTTAEEAHMRIIHFERDGDFSFGVATGEGLGFRFAVANATCRIELLQQRVGDLQTLVAVQMADAAWQRGEGPAMPTVVIAAEP